MFCHLFVFADMSSPFPWFARRMLQLNSGWRELIGGPLGIGVFKCLKMSIRSPLLSEKFVEHVSITKQTSQSRREVGCSSGALSVGQDFVNRWDLEAWGLRWFESENGDTIRIHQIPSSEKAILTGTMMRNQQIWGYAYVYAPTYIYIWSRPPSLHPPKKC
jgi:hypothetical protein